MKIRCIENKLERLNSNILAVSLFKEEKINTDIEEIEIIANDFDAEYGKFELSKVLINDNLIDIFLVGMGRREDLNNEKLRVLGGNLSRKAKNIAKDKGKNLDIINLNLTQENIGAFAEGILLGDYKFDKYKSEKCNGIIENVNLYSDIDATEQLKRAEIMAKSTIIARDLVNEPSNVIYPETLANEAIRLGEEYGFEVEVYEQGKIEALGMEAYLSVARGSSNKPRFIVMRYFADKENEEILGLVGKGITYDTGGYCIKSRSSMFDMKTDMAGGASVIGAMCAIANQKLNKNVVGVIAACENSISGEAYKPGDIINSMAKKTIEVGNTDAEGRLTLADAVYYIINNEKANKVVDVATLTGAAIVALGTIASAVVTNNEEFYKEVEVAAQKSGEKIWKMPVFDEYKKMIKGHETDLKNAPGQDGGCITAGLFVGEFVGDTPWVHIDIAGPSVVEKTEGYKYKGATGEAVRTLYYLAEGK